MQIGAVSALVASIAALAIRAYLRKSSTPEKRERQRRLAVNTQGRLGDALITEVSETDMYYTYSVRGVQYTASQDFTSLRDRMPVSPERLIGRSGMKYLTRNPANSILLCEEWSGLRMPAQPALSNGDGIRHETQDPALAEGFDR
jgi:hypothetical protein